MDIVKGKIGNALTSAASNHVVATANDIYDESIGKYQNEINGGFYSLPIAAALGISTKYDADNNLVLNIPFSQGGKSRNKEVVIPLVTSTNPGLMQASVYNDIKFFVGKGVVNKDITFEIDVNNPNNVKLSYYAYEGNNVWANKSISIPLVGNNAGLMTTDMYNHICNIRNSQPVCSDMYFTIQENDPTKVGLIINFYDSVDDKFKTKTLDIPNATENNAGLMGKWEYDYVHTLNLMQLLSGIINVTASEDNVSLKYEVQNHGKQTLVIPKATLQSAGVISKEDYTALRTLIDNSASTDSPYGEYPLMLGQPITFENVNGSLNMKWMAISPGGEPYNSTAIIPTVNNNCPGLMSSSSYLHLNNLLDAHLVKDVNVISTYKANESDTTTQTAIEITKYSSITPTKTTLPIPAATSTSSGVMTPAQVAFIDYHQGHNTYDDFADIPVDKHICIVNLNYTTGEGETSKALTVVMDGIGKYDGAEVLLYCNHNGSAKLGIGVPANSTNGAEYVLITNDGQQYIFVGTQELDFVFSCTYINNKWYVKKL